MTSIAAHLALMSINGSFSVRHIESIGSVLFVVTSDIPTAGIPANVNLY